MTNPSGEQHQITGGGYRAVVTESGAALRLLEYEDRPLLDGFAVDQMSPGGRGQVLAPWPNRIRDGRYSWDGRDLQLGLTEPARHNASHGLVRWVAWSVEEVTASSVSLVYRLMAQTGYPWTLDLRMSYDLSALGLTVTHTAANRSDGDAPYACGAHPYLAVGEGIDGLELLLPAGTRMLGDERRLPVGRESVDETPYDFRVPRPLRDTVLDDAFTDLTRDPEGRTTVELRDPRTGHGVALWVDEHHGWLQVYSADDQPATARRSLAVEPMTAPPDAFRSGEDVVRLAPGEELTASWGLAAL